MTETAKTNRKINHNNDKKQISSQKNSFFSANFWRQNWQWFAIAFITIIVIITGIWWWQGRTGRIVNIFTTERQLQLSYIKESLDWVDRMRDGRGLYADMASCSYDDTDSNWSCFGANESNRAFLPVIWAKYQYYLQTQDNSVLPGLYDDITLAHKILIEDGYDIIQNNAYNCLYIRDMLANESQLNIFDDTTEQNLRDFCLISEYAIFDQINLPEFASDPHLETTPEAIQTALEIYLASANEKIDLINSGDISSYNPNEDDFLISRDSSNIEKMIMLTQPRYYYFAQDYLARYQLNQNPLDLLMSVIMLDDVLSLYLAQLQPDANPNLIFEMADCHLTAILDEFKLVAPQLDIHPLNINFAFTNNPEKDYSSYCYLAHLHDASSDNSALKTARQVIIETTGYQSASGEGTFFVNFLPNATNTNTRTIADIIGNAILIGIMSR